MSPVVCVRYRSIRHIDRETAITYGAIMSFHVFGLIKLCEDGFGEYFSEFDAHLVYDTYISKNKKVSRYR
jgi:hypothetical protein